MQVFAAVIRGFVGLAVSLIFVDQSEANPVPLEESAGIIQMTGTVQVIVIPTRLITVVGPGGNTVVGVLSPNVKNIEAIKLNETVTISFTQEVAVALRGSDAPPVTKEQGIVAEEEAGMSMNAPTVAEQDWVDLTPSGGTSQLTTIEVTDTVAAVNHRKRTITFAGVGGKTRTVYIDPSVPGLDQIQPGDMVVLEVTRSSIVNVKLS
jgi:hypothetical protein